VQPKLLENSGRRHPGHRSALDGGAASIEIELLTEHGAGELTSAGNIAGLWNSSRHAEAIDVLRRFETAGARVAVGVSWGTGTGEARWTNNFSWTHGSTWTETYAWFSSIGIVDVDAAVVGDWLYVGYIAGGHGDEVRVRRCHVADGRVDNSYYYKVALDAGASSFTEMVLSTDADDYDSEVYVLAIQADAVLRFAWATATDGILTDVAPPATANVSDGLSATYGMHGAFCAYEKAAASGTGLGAPQPPPEDVSRGPETPRVRRSQAAARS